MKRNTNLKRDKNKQKDKNQVVDLFQKEHNINSNEASISNHLKNKGDNK